jgi:hypothetical protein
MRRDVERAMWLADNPANTAANMPPNLPPRLARKASEFVAQNSVMAAGPDGPVDFWKWANGRLAEEQVRAKVPEVTRTPSLRAPQTFDLEDSLKHARRQLPEVGYCAPFLFVNETEDIERLLCVCDVVCVFVCFAGC